MWCDFEGSGQVLNPSDGTCDKEDDAVKITSAGFDYGDDATDAAQACKVISIAKYDVYPWGKRANPAVRKNPYGQPYRFKFRCEDGVVTQRWEPVKGYWEITPATR